MANRRTFITAAALTAFSYCSITAANAVLVAEWNFDGTYADAFWGAGSSFTGTSFGNYLAEVGAGTMFGIRTNTQTNVTWTRPAGNGTRTSASGIGLSANDTYWEFNVSTINLKDLLISYDQVSSNTGPRNWKLQYKVGAGSYVDVASYNIGYNSAGATLSWASSAVRTESQLNFNLSSIAALNNKASVFLRVLIAGTQQYNPTATAAFGTAGSTRIDSIKINATAVPEPESVLILAAGAAIAATRKRSRK